MKSETLALHDQYEKQNRRHRGTHVVKTNPHLPFLPCKQIPLRVERRTLGLDYVIWFRRFTSLVDEVRMILARGVNLVSIEWLNANFAEESAAVILAQWQRQDPLDSQVPRHFDTDIQRIRVMIGVAVIGETHVEVALERDSQ